MKTLFDDLGIWIVFTLCIIGLSFLTVVGFVKGLWKEVTG